jgi:hypothetical protein
MHGAFHLQIEVENQSDINLHSMPPFPVHLSYHWIDERGSIVVFDGERTPLVPALGPGMVRHYAMRFLPPGAPGRWTLRLTLVQEAVRWLDQPPTSLWCDIPVYISNS